MPVLRKLREFVDTLGEFGLALWHHWVGFVSGSVVMAIVLALYERFAHPIPNFYYLGMLFIGFMVGAYLAWAEEYEKREAAEVNLQKMKEESKTRRPSVNFMHLGEGAHITGSTFRNIHIGGRGVARRLTPEQRATMLSRLREDIPLRKQFDAEGRKMEVYIYRTLGATDAEPFALDVEGVLKGAGFLARNMTHAAITVDEVEFDGMPEVRGVRIVFNPDNWLYDQIPNFPQLLLDAMRDAGVEVEFAKGSRSEVAVVIGPAE